MNEPPASENTDSLRALILRGALGGQRELKVVQQQLQLRLG